MRRVVTDSPSRLRRGARVVETRPLAGSAVAAGAGSGLLLIARAVRFGVSVIVGFIVAAILLRVFEANAGNSVVSFVHDVGHAFVGPFDSIFTIDNPKTEMAVNWGIAAVLWSIVGGFVANAIARAGLAGLSR